VPRLGGAAAATALVLWAVRRAPASGSELVDDADSDTLRAHGYLPFGVGLSIAAFILGIVIGAPAVRAGFDAYAASIGL
jgi:hypothetical protein